MSETMFAKLVGCLLFLLPALPSGRLLLDVRGNLEVVPIQADSNFTLPSVTYLRDETGTPINLLEQLRTLQERADTLQLLIQELQSRPPACDWEGVRCHCFFKSSASLDDYLVLSGTNCSSGRRGVTKVLDMLIATTISTGCAFFNTTSRCTDVIQ